MARIGLAGGVFGSVANKGVTSEFLGSVANKRVERSGEWPLEARGKQVATGEKRQERSLGQAELAR